MSVKLKPLFQQVMLLSGATGQIGRATLYAAVEKGMKVFMVDMDEDELQNLQDDMRRKGYVTAYAVENFGEEDQMAFAADECLKTFGGIDTWVNISGTMPLTGKKIFETNFMNLVTGCKVAVDKMRDRGGVIINIGTSLYGESYPGEGVDEASKDAVRIYSDTLRKEIKGEKLPIEVTTIIPGTVEAVVNGILVGAQKPKKEISTKASFLDRFLPDKTKPKIQKSLLARGLSGVAVAGGLTFLIFKKVR